MSVTTRIERILCGALAAGVLACGSAAQSASPAWAGASTTTGASASASGRTFQHDFQNLQDVAAFQSGLEVNDALKASDKGVLQQPVLKSNVQVIDDPAAQDGKAMAVYTRKASYRTSSGMQEAWSNGRMAITGHDAAPPVHISARLRLTAAVHTKSAVMWWPAGGGWPWEVDFAETFGGHSTHDYWGGRQHVGQRWHADLDGDRLATEQLIHDDHIDATKYHVYDLHILADRMWIEIDGRKTFETTDKRFIPRTAGFFTVGKALTERRDSSARTADAVVVDYVRIHEGASPQGPTPPPPPPPAPNRNTAYYVNAYDPTIYAVRGESRSAVSYAQWAAAGFPRPAASPTEYVRYPWSSTVYAVTFWPGTWQWDRLDYARWATAGYPAVRHAGWIEGSVIRKHGNGNQLFLHDPDGGVHALTYQEWQDTGFRPVSG